jgi:hypothetical protein
MQMQQQATWQLDPEQEKQRRIQAQLQSDHDPVCTSQQTRDTQAVLNRLLAEYEGETDPVKKAFLFNKAVYWSIEVDIEMAYDRIFNRN